jgi:hypothetical protein
MPGGPSGENIQVCLVPLHPLSTTHLCSIQTVVRRAQVICECALGVVPIQATQ